MGAESVSTANETHCPQIGAIMTKIDPLYLAIGDFTYAWRMDMVPNTICNFATEGSAYTVFEEIDGVNGISVYYTKDNCPDPDGTEVDDVSAYATSDSYFHARYGLFADEAVCEM